MAEQGAMSNTIQSTQSCMSDKCKDIPTQDQTVTTKVVLPPYSETEENEFSCTAKKLENEDSSCKEPADNSNVSQPLKQESGAEKIHPIIEETESSIEATENIPVYNSGYLDSTDRTGDGTTGIESTDLSTFFNYGSTLWQGDTESNTNTELEGLSYPLTAESHGRRGTEDKPYGCKFCIRRFAHSSSLYRHQKSHMETKQYKCDQCDKEFTSASNLNVHSRIHTGLKPYECSDCGKKFTRKFGLDQHLKSHSQDKLYICSHCGKSYNDYFFLVKHQQLERDSVPFLTL